ncbi:MAG: Dabb family protein, partial [Rhizobiaceae bacterium]
DISRISYACDVVLYSEFDDEAALKLYAAHPAHAKVRAELEGIRIARHQVDYIC